LLTVLGERVAQTYRIEAPVLTRARHRQAIEEAAASLRRSFSACCRSCARKTSA